MSAPQVVSDLLQVQPDTAQVDTAQAAPPDTSSAIAQVGATLSENLSQASRLLLNGEWEQLWFMIYGGLIDLAVNFVPDLIAALLLLAVLYLLYRITRKVLHRVMDRSRRVDAGLHGLLMKSFTVVAFVLITAIVLGRLGFDVTALIAGLSIAGIALGFAARDTLENFIAGVTILMDKPFRVGDNIEVEDQFGTVEEITLRSTRVRTINNEVVVMPNTHMINNKLLNHTMLSTMRVVIPFGIAYKEHPQEAREVLLKMAESDDRLHPDYDPSVVVTEMGASSVDMQLRLYLRNPKIEVPFRYEYIEKVFDALTKADIEIPFPHRQLLIDEAKAFEGSALLEPPHGGDGEAGNGGTGETEISA